jgi:DNA-binding HxlR family transcriptional regulator
MSLPKDYRDQRCSLARSLEVLGERWTLLIIRDALYGGRRFSDFVEHLAIPRSVLANRLETLVEHGVLAKVSPSDRGYSEYEITGKGKQLWPAIRVLMSWGDEHYTDGEPPLSFRHVHDGGQINADGICTVCNEPVALADTLATPGATLKPRSDKPGAITGALLQGHRLLEDVRSSAAPAQSSAKS